MRVTRQTELERNFNYQNDVWGHPVLPTYDPDNPHQKRYGNRRSAGHRHGKNRPNKLCPVCHQRVWPEVKNAYPQMSGPKVDGKQTDWVWVHREKCLPLLQKETAEPVAVVEVEA